MYKELRCARTANRNFFVGHRGSRDCKCNELHRLLLTQGYLTNNVTLLNFFVTSLKIRAFYGRRGGAEYTINGNATILMFLDVTILYF